jgi:thioredoxin-like negative regulator of GroEL
MVVMGFSILVFSIVLHLLFPALAHAAELPSLKVLSTPSCPACAQMYRVLDEIDSQYGGKLTTEKINLYEHRDIAQQYNVRYVPHLLFVDASGDVVKEKVGYVSLEEVLKTFQEVGINVA